MELVAAAVDTGLDGDRDGVNTIGSLTSKSKRLKLLLLKVLWLLLFIIVLLVLDIGSDGVDVKSN